MDKIQSINNCWFIAVPYEKKWNRYDHVYRFSRIRLFLYFHEHIFFFFFISCLLHCPFFYFFFFLVLRFQLTRKNTNRWKSPVELPFKSNYCSIKCMRSFFPSFMWSIEGKCPLDDRTTSFVTTNRKVRSTLYIWIKCFFG